MPSRTKPIALAAVLLLVAGCGSSKDDTPTLTKAEFVSKANAICRTASKQAPAFPGRKSGSGLVTTARLVTPYLEKTLEVENRALAQLRALKPPASHQKAVEELITAQAARVLDLNQALDSARNRDTGGFTTAVQNDQTQDGPRYLRAARKLGLTDCVRGGL